MRQGFLFCQKKGFALIKNFLGNQRRLQSTKIPARVVKVVKTSSTKMQEKEELLPNNNPTVKAKVARVWPISPSVRGVEMVVEAPFSFRAGQWVDAMLPGVEQVGGFSICSPPCDLPRLTLAVRESRWPPTRWLYERCEAGSELRLRAGGDFHLDMSEDRPHRRLLLVAGGVGVNPLLSMARHLAAAPPRPAPPRLSLLYSAHTPQDLLFRDVLDDLSRDDHVSVTYLVTRCSDPSPPVKHDRISERVLRKALADLVRTGRPSSGEEGRKDLPSGEHLVRNDSASSGEEERKEPPSSGEEYYSSVEAFICGPPSMIEFVEECLVRCGAGSVMYEKWW